MKIIYSFVTYKLSKNDKDLFFFKKLDNQKFIIKTVDLSYFIFNKSINKDDCDISFNKLEQLEKLLQNGHIFIINFDRVLTHKNIFDLLKKYNNSYIQISNGRTAYKRCSIKSIKGFTYFLKKIIKNKLFLLDFFYKRLYKNIDAIHFASGTVENSILMPSFEFDKFLKIKNKNKSLQEGYHLFLDQNLGYSRDVQHFFNKHISDPDKYSRDLNIFFNKLEKETNKKVKIALHPRTNHSKYNFENREVYINQTAELVANADIVIGHYSTSIHYPIIFNKNLLLLSNNQMDYCLRLKLIEAFAEELNIPILNIDKDYKISDILSFFNKQEYGNFINKYIISNKILDKNKFGYEYLIENIQNIIKEGN